MKKHQVQETKKAGLNIQAIPSIDIYTKRNKFVKTFLVIILFITVTLRFAYLAQLQNNPLPFAAVGWKGFDQYKFMTLATEFIQGNWLGSVVTSYSCVYSYLIAFLYKIFAHSLNTLFVFQILVALIAVYVFYKTASILFNNKKVGLIAASIAALYSPLIFYECCMLRASIIAYSNLFGFYFLLKSLKKKQMEVFLFRRDYDRHLSDPEAKHTPVFYSTLHLYRIKKAL